MFFNHVRMYSSRIIIVVLWQLIFGINMAFAVVNTEDLDIDYAFVVPVPFINSGSLFVIGSGSIVGDLLDAKSLHIGKDKEGHLNPTNFITDGNIGGTATIHIYNDSSFTAADHISGVTDSFIVDQNSTATFNKSLSGRSFFNHGNVIAADGSFLSIDRFSNNGVITAAGTIIAPTFFINNHKIYVYGNGQIFATIYGNGSLNIGVDPQDNIIPSTFALQPSMEHIPVINVFSGSELNVNNGTEFNVNNSIAGLGTIVNYGTLTCGADAAITTSAVVNNGVLNTAVGVDATLGDSYSGTGIVNNYGNLYINKAFGSGEINNKSGANLYLQAGANAMSNSIFNDVNGNLIIASDIVMPSKTLVNNGVISVGGSYNVELASYVSPGVHNFYISNTELYGSITANNAIDLTDGIVNIDACGLATNRPTYDWTVLSAPNIITNNATVVNAPQNTMFRTWQSTVTDQNISVNLTRMPFAAVNATGVQYDIAVALDSISDIESDAACSLVNSVAGCCCHVEYLSNLAQLAPLANSSNNNVAVHNSSLNKVEMRIAAVRERAPSLTLASKGIAYGDFNSNMSMWMGGFGSVANQQTTSSIVGYRATAAGGLIGADWYNYIDNLYGVALGFSNSNIDESISSNNLRILGYHALFYGSGNINKDNFFEWLATGIINNNKGSRFVNIGGTNFNVNYNYHSWQAGFRFNVGQCINFDSWKFSPIETMRYIALQQPGYDEVGSPAALHVASQGLGNILTFGVGARISAYSANKWLAKTRELRIIATYDVVSSGSITTANFITGGPDFSVSSSAARAALQLGASYGFAIEDHMQLEFSYDFEVRNKYTDNSGEVKIRYVF